MRCVWHVRLSVVRWQVALDIKAAADSVGKTMCWKGHSMGCYLLLNVVDRLRWKGEDMRGLFGAVILDAPDVPTWFFRSMTKVSSSFFVRMALTDASAILGTPRKALTHPGQRRRATTCLA